MPHSQPLCDFCNRNPATVFVTRIAHQNTSKQRLCPDCARRHAAGKEWVKTSAPLIGDGDIPDNLALDEVVQELFQQMKKSQSNGDFAPPQFAANDDQMEEDFDADDFEEAGAADESDFSEDELETIFSEMESALDEVLNDEILDNSAAKGVLPSAPHAAREVVSARCPKCGTTWDRLREDGRAGCAQCYLAFNDKLVAVMEKMQRGAHHTGKLPRAALKRRRRLEHLRARRDHRLEMLKRRLEEAVTNEKYEDAAQLRDKIKVVVSTIVGNDLD